MPLLQEGSSIVRRAQLSDIDYLESRLRQSDVKEIWASSNRTSRESLLNGFKSSIVCLTAVKEDIPYCMFGLLPDVNYDGYASIWLLGTPVIDEIPKTFMVLTKKVIDLFQLKYPILFNYVDCRNKKSIQWLEHFGAEFDAPCSYGLQQIPFQLFRLSRSSHV